MPGLGVGRPRYRGGNQQGDCEETQNGFSTNDGHGDSQNDHEW